MSSMIFTLVPTLLLSFLSLRSAYLHSRNITYAPLSKPITYLLLMPLLGYLTMDYPFIERIVYAAGLIVYVRIIEEFSYLETLMFIGSGDRHVTRRMFEERYHSMEEDKEGVSGDRQRRSRELRESLLNVSYERLLAEEKVIKEVYEGEADKIH